jgi:hypothetical protein
MLVRLKIALWAMFLRALRCSPTPARVLDFGPRAPTGIK